MRFGGPHGAKTPGPVAPSSPPLPAHPACSRPLAPQPAIRIAIRIRNPYRMFFSARAVTGHFLWPGLFAIRKIRTFVNSYRKSVIRIMNP
jgi:hypothetical protein